MLQSAFQTEVQSLKMLIFSSSYTLLNASSIFKKIRIILLKYIILHFSTLIDCFRYLCKMSRDMRFPTMWYKRPAVWSEPLLVALIFYEC